MKKGRKNKLSDGIEVRYHWENILWSLLVGPLILLLATVFQSGIVWSFGLLASLYGILASLYFSNSHYFNYNEDRIITPHSRSAFGKRNLFIINGPNDIKIDNGAIKVKYKKDVLGKVTTYVDKNGEPNKIIARKSRSHSDDWEKFINWINNFKKRHIIKN